MTNYDKSRLITQKMLEEYEADGVITPEEAKHLLTSFDYTSDTSRALLVEEIVRYRGDSPPTDDERLRRIIEDQTKRLAELNAPALRQIEAQQMRERLATPPPPPPISFPMSANKKRNLVFAAIVGLSTLSSLIIRLFLL